MASGSRQPGLVGSALLFACILWVWPAVASAQEPDTRELSAIHMEGLTRVPAETLLSIMELQVGQQYASEDLPVLTSQAIRRIFSIGYFTDVRVYRKLVGTDRFELTFVILEKFIVSNIKLVGNDKIEEEDIRKTFTIKTGRFLDVTKLIETLRSIEELYQDKGYYLAEASYEVTKDEATRTALVTIRVKEQQTVDVRKVVFVGNEALKDQELKAFMQTREQTILSFLQDGGLFMSYFFQLEETSSESMDGGQFESWSAHEDIDLQRVKWLYLTRGYVQVKTGQPRLSLTPDHSGVVITVDVEEGPRFKVGQVDVMSNDADGLLFEKEELLKKLSLKSGEWFNAQNVMMDTQMLSNRYMNKGYAFVSVSNTPYPDQAAKTLDLTYVVQKGNPTYIGNIILVGNETTADKVIRREMRIAEGDLFHQNKLDRSKALIFRLGFFEDVQIETRPSNNPAMTSAAKGSDEVVSYVDLVVKVKERDTGIFQVGAGFSSLESYLFQARVSKNNFLGRGQTLSFQALLSSLRSIYMISSWSPTSSTPR